MIQSISRKAVRVRQSDVCAGAIPDFAQRIDWLNTGTYICQHMRKPSVPSIAAALALLSSCAPTSAVVQLQPDQPTVLHVGDIAAVQVPSNAHYSIGLAGTSLMQIKQQERRGLTIYLYRSVAVGNQTLVATPRDPGPDGCVSCVTVHYFIQVID